MEKKCDEGRERRESRAENFGVNFHSSTASQVHEPSKKEKNKVDGPKKSSRRIELIYHPPRPESISKSSAEIIL